MQAPSPSIQSPPPKLRLPEGLNAAQIGAVQNAILDIANQMKLRQWCIEKALEFSTTEPLAMALAADIYNFIVPALPEKSLIS